MLNKMIQPKIEVEIVWEQFFENEHEFYLSTFDKIEGGYCTCGNKVTRPQRKCPVCGVRMKFVPFKPIKTNLTPRQYTFLNKHTLMNKIEISHTTKEQAIQIIYGVIEGWKMTDNGEHRDEEYDEQQPF